MNNFVKESVLNLTVAQNSQNCSYIKHSYFTSPLKIMKSFSRKDKGITVFQQSSSAGLMEGDRHTYNITVEQNAILELLGISYEKIFKSHGNDFSQRSVNCNVQSNATLIYTPQPCIPFAGSDCVNKLSFNLEQDTSRLVYCDCITAGRIQSGEVFDYRRYSSLLEIKQQGHLLYRDNTIFNGSDEGQEPVNKQKLSSTVMYDGYTHYGTMIIYNYNIQKQALLDTLGLQSKLLYNYDFDNTDKSKPLISYTQPKGNGIVIRILGNNAQMIEEIFNSVKKILNY